MPHEIIVWYLVPALRKEIVLELKKHKISQSIIAKKMDLTEAAVSQYLHNKRASNNIHLTNVLLKEIKVSAKKILDGNDKMVAAKELIKLINISNKEKIICGNCALKHKNCNLCIVSA